MLVAPLVFFLAQQGATISPAVALYARAKIKMADALRRMPNYTCLETIERTKRLPKRRKYEPIDILRLEVGLVEGKELFAWPGSGKFEDRELAEMVPGGGVIGNGSFAAHAAAVFRSSAASIVYTGKAEDRTPPQERYEFRVPQNLSGYRLRTGMTLEAVIGYHGAFFVDPENDRVMRIELAGDDIPPVLQVLATEASIDYGLVRIGELDYWLPVGSTMTITNLDATEYRNEIKFSACRQFAGESTLSFGDPPPEAAGPAPVSLPEELVLPKDKVLTMHLDQPVGWGITSTGDKVEATLSADLKHKGAMLFPRGSKVTGRVVRMQANGNGNMAEIEFETITDGKRHAPFRASLGDAPDVVNRGAAGRPKEPWIVGAKGRPGVLVIVTWSTKLHLMKGYRTNWTTIE